MAITSVSIQWNAGPLAADAFPPGATIGGYIEIVNGSGDDTLARVEWSTTDTGTGASATGALVYATVQCGPNSPYVAIGDGATTRVPVSCVAIGPVSATLGAVTPGSSSRAVYAVPCVYTEGGQVVADTDLLGNPQITITPPTWNTGG